MTMSSGLIPDHSWCWNHRKCHPVVDDSFLQSVTNETQFYSSQMAGKIGHDPLFLPVEPGIFRLPASLAENPPAISFCEYEMRSVVVREVISDWYDDTTGKVDIS